MIRQSVTDIDLRSPAFPGGSLLEAMYDRRLMQLSDKGGASGMIGDRWSDICAGVLTTCPDRVRTVEGSSHGLELDIVARLDDTPSIARIASRRGLQNPDFLLVGHSGETPTLRALDAKFSVDTAKPRQVSADVTRALLDLGPVIGDVLPRFEGPVTIVDGVFLSPDFSLTRHLLASPRIQRRAVVDQSQVRLVVVDAEDFAGPLEHDRPIALFDALDDLPVDASASLLLTLYYFRLSRAAVSCWADMSSPLLPYRDFAQPDIDAVIDDLSALTTSGGSGWSLVLRYDRRAEDIRRQRAAIENAAELPIPGRRIRERVAALAAAAAAEPPSASKVRRLLGSWFRQQLRAEFGPLPPPVADIDALVRQVTLAARERVPDVEAQLDEIVLDLVSAPESPAAR